MLILSIGTSSTADPPHALPPQSGQEDRQPTLNHIGFLQYKNSLIEEETIKQLIPVYIIVCTDMGVE